MNRKFKAAASGALVALLMSAAALAGKVNINTAGVDELATGIKGVGPAIAERIVKWREENGPFESVDQIVEVSGVGAKTLENNRDNLVVEASSE
ncbi:MAG: helix-hairpin-helix domain-containing protein [Proteobacteria bacterium]|nr:MAG: helix-hairpin-helix domain-containing protein [Pseudomonadota bacterium]